MSRGLKHLLVKLGIVLFGFLSLLHPLLFWVPMLSIFLMIIGFAILMMGGVILVGDPLPPFNYHKCKKCDKKADVTAYVSCEYGPIVQGHYCYDCAKKLQRYGIRYQFS